MTLKAIINDAGEGGFWAEVPAVPRCFTSETLPELETNLREAIEGWLLAVEPSRGPAACPERIEKLRSN